MTVSLFFSCEKTDTESVFLEDNGSFTDARDDNEYKWIKIGAQVWMAENLQFASGTNIEDNSAWGNLVSNNTDDAYCYYNNYANGEKVTYGCLYTFSAALSACPSGWHLPNDAEWKTLEMHLGMSKSDADNIGWRGTNEGAQLADSCDLWNNGDYDNLTTNYEVGKSGFAALPGGYRDSYSGTFLKEGNSGNWWSSTETDSNYAYCRTLYYSRTTVERMGWRKSSGFSVRCVKD